MLISRCIALALTCALLASPVAGAQEEPRGLRSPDTSIGSGLETNPMNPVTISTYTAADRPTSAPLDVSGSDNTGWTTILLVAGAFALAVMAVAVASAVRGRRRVAVHHAGSVTN